MNDAEARADAQLLVRRPGLYRRWELLKAMGVSESFHFEEVAETRDGTALFALYDIIGPRSEWPGSGGREPENGWVCLPGLYRRSEVKLPADGGSWRFEYAGLDAQGDQLLRIYHLVLQASVPTDANSGATQ